MAARDRTGPFMVFIKADCRMRPLSDFYSTLIGSRNGLPSASRRQRLLKLPHRGGGGLQGYAGELPTWQKACGLITHGSQGAKNKPDQEANRERESETKRKKVTGQ